MRTTEEMIKYLYKKELQRELSHNESILDNFLSPIFYKLGVDSSKDIRLFKGKIEEIKQELKELDEDRQRSKENKKT